MRFFLFPSPFLLLSPHRQFRAATHGRILRLSVAIAAFESPFLRRTGWRPRRAGGIRLQESCDLFFGKTIALDVRISFQNTHAVIKDHEVKISILVIKSADGSVVAQVALDQIAI